jgi:hypothetical protein
MSVGLCRGTRWQSCASVLVVITVCVVAPSCAAGAPAREVCSSGRGQPVTIHLRLRLEPLATPEFPDFSVKTLEREAPSLATSIESAFAHGNYAVDGSPVRVSVSMSVSAPLAKVGDENVIVVTPNPSFVSQTTVTDVPWGRPVSGLWSLADLHDTGHALHEIGHILGLGDEYDDFVIDASGHEVRAPEGMESDSAGHIRDAASWSAWASQQGIDPTNMYVRSTPRPGHEDDIMATTTGRFQDDALRQILAFAGPCPQAGARRSSAQRCSGAHTASSAFGGVLCGHVMGLPDTCSEQTDTPPVVTNGVGAGQWFEDRSTEERSLLQALAPMAAAQNEIGSQLDALGDVTPGSPSQAHDDTLRADLRALHAEEWPLWCRHLEIGVQAAYLTATLARHGSATAVDAWPSAQRRWSSQAARMNAILTPAYGGMPGHDPMTDEGSSPPAAGS